VSPDGQDWYVINATPDITAQLARWPELHPKEGVRHTPIRGVLLTDGELDHTLGLLHLREGADWRLYATSAVLGMLREKFQVLPVLARYTNPDAEVVQCHKPLMLGEGSARLAIRWVETGCDSPLYTGNTSEVPGAVTALILEDTTNGRRLAYAPGIGQLTEKLFEELSSADVVFFDGTFWSEDEFPRLSGRPRSARDMGHVPINGPDGSAAWLADLPAKIKRYIHINNTNPVLDPTSEQRQEIRKYGLEVAEDGDEVEI
jgi:pyrroloquinoline quinone biosynthesis protein B